MSRVLLRAGVYAAAIWVLAAASPLMAQSAFDEAQTKAIESIIRNYLLKNPEVLSDVSDELRKRMESKAEDQRKTALKTLYNEQSPYSAGQGDVTLVEFFDYNCGYCRKAFTDLVKLMESDKKVRVVFIEFPILTDESRLAAQAAIAAAKQNKYFEMHRALLTAQGQLNETKIFKAAADAGLDVEKLKKDMKDPSVDQVIEQNLQLGTSIGIQGTPAFFVGDTVIPGAPQNLVQQLTSAVEHTRKNGCAACAKSPEKKS